jgi:hypothetical protein
MLGPSFGRNSWNGTRRFGIGVVNARRTRAGGEISRQKKEKAYAEDTESAEFAEKRKARRRHPTMAC